MDVQIAIRRLQGEAEAEQAAKMMAASEPWLTLGRSYESSLAILQDPMREVYVAKANDLLVGFVILIMQGAFVGYIQTVCVDPQWRNRGLGSKLIDFAEQRILKESPNIFLCVSSFNPAARRLYERLGYEVIGTLKSYIIAHHSEILMRKTIAPIADFKASVHVTES
jgi:[ribosomal protein S18]-alanine N-acetyltransferase